MPPQLKPFESQMGENAFQLLAPQDHERTFMFIPQRSGSNELGFVVLNQRRVRQGKQKVASQISYISRNDIAWFHSPSFSPNGKEVLIQEGYSPEDIDYAANFFIWEQDSGRLRPMRNEATRVDRILWSPGSRFLSYTHGGRSYNGPLAHAPDPYELWCLDIPSRREHLVIKNPGFDWSWTYHGQILCSTSTSDSKAPTEHSPYSSIYEVNATGGTPRKLFERGFLPSESPDGRWIAFYDWPDVWYRVDLNSDTQNMTHDGLKPRLCLFDRNTHKRQWVGILNVENDGKPSWYSPEMQWSLDGKALFVLVQFIDSSDQRTATLYRMDQSSHALSVVVTFKSEESRTDPYRFFRLRGISADSTHLYVECIISVLDVPNPSTRSILYSINARTGNQVALAQIFNISGINCAWDFRDNVPLNPTSVAAEKLENALSNNTKSAPTKKRVRTGQRQKGKPNLKNSRR